MSTPAEASALAVLSGLSAHAVYNRFEPSVKAYIAELVLLVTAYGGCVFILTNAISQTLVLSTAFTILHLATLASSIIVYRVYLHPLRKYPGPLIAKITKLYGVYTAWTGMLHNIYPELLEQYGDVVRIGPNELVFGNAAAVKDVHGANSMKVAKGPNYDVRLWASGRSLGEERNIQAHRLRRKIWDKGLNTKSILQYESRVLAIVEQFCAELELNVDKEINVSNWVDCFAFDVMGDLAFNETFGFIKEKKADSLAGFVRSGLKTTHFFRNINWLAPLYPFLPKDPSTKDQLAQFVKLSSNMYLKRRAMGTEPHDLFTHLLKPDETTGFAMNETDLASDSPVIIIAGSDTTSVTLTFTLYYMTRNPSVQKKLLKETDEVWEKHGNPLAGNKLGADNMPYMHGVLNEVLRLLPAEPGGNQRTTPPEGHTINGEFIRGNTQVLCSPMFLHRDPRSFTNPGLFVPERWDDEKRDPTWNHDVRGYIPFSAGQYVCPGKALAYLEMRFFLVRMLRDFEFEMSPDFDQEALWLGLKSYMGWFKPPIPLTVRKRDRARRPIVEAL